MRLLACLFLAAQLGAMGRRPPQDLYAEAVKRFQAGDFDEAGALFKALAPADPRARKAWLAFLFERQGYGALEAELAGPRDDFERALLARALANQSKWPASLAALEGLGGSEALLLRAQALDALGSSLAAQAWEAALQIPKRDPLASLAFFKAADFSARQGAAEEAELRYKRAERLDQAATAVHRRLAQLYQEEGRFKDAKARLERALKVDPLDLESRDCLNLLLRAKPALVAEAKAREAKREAERLGKTNPRVAALPLSPGEPLLRVGVLPLASRFKFRTGGPTLLEPQGLLLPGGAVFEVALKGTKWRLARVDAAGSSREAVFEGAQAALSPQDPSSTLSFFDVDFGSGTFWAGKEDRAFRGAFELRFEGMKGVSAVNLIPLDAYLLAVLPGEMPSTWPAEAQLAQAVAARGDALSKRGRHKAQGFDVCSDVHCAMYRGVDGENAASSWAVTATAGEILEENGRPLGGLYMNSCGGHTQDSWETWAGEPMARRHAVADFEEGPAFPLDPQGLLAWLEEPAASSMAWCAREGLGPYSEFRWCARYSREELELSVARRHDIGRLLAVEPLERSSGGQVRRLRFSGSKGSSIGSSDYIRSAVKGLRSNLFFVETRRGEDGEAAEFLFHGGGWGHGVGLCQVGAAGMAMAGKKHGEILRHYFQGSDIRKLY
jgi:stage II sporulation protein D